MSVFKPKYRDKRTGKLRESQVWWFEFCFAGKRVRQSSGTTKKTLAKRAEEAHYKRLERALAGLPSEEPKSRVRSVSECLKAHLGAYPINHRPKSVSTAKERSAHVERLLGACLLPDLTEAKIQEYITERLSEGVSGRTVNLEVSLLSRAIGHKWALLWPKVKRLEERSDIGRALSADEESRILQFASRSRSPLIYCYVQVLVWTGLRADEARTLRWEQVNLDAGEIIVGASKTAAGKGRRIPLTATLRAVLEQHAARYATWFGPIEPHWHVFPKSRRVKPIDPAEPVGSLKGAWGAVRKDAKVNARLHDLRHSFASKLAESGVPEHVALSLMGHVSRKMLERYSHARAESRRLAIDAIESGNLYGVPKVSPKVSRKEVAEKPVTH